tara:strand:- start:903 stop:1229 length:327 start_codon:yes stop_codon:yes gene_type:complete
MSEQVLNSSGEGSMSVDSWKTTITHRGKNRMKITFKLNREEAAAFQAFQDGVQPEGLSEENFVKSIFFLGLTTLEQNVSQRIAESMTVEDGEVSLDVPVESLEDEDAE